MKRTHLPASPAEIVEKHRNQDECPFQACLPWKLLVLTQRQGQDNVHSNLKDAENWPTATFDLSGPKRGYRVRKKHSAQCT